MRKMGFLVAALIGIAAGQAEAAGICRAERLSCATNMPVGGYCECTARGTTESGTVMSRADTRKPVDSTAGGCGANPKAPGCH